MREIADLTDEQLLRIYMRMDPRDPKAKHVDREGQVMPYREIYENIWAKRGLTPEQIQARWDEEVASGVINP